MNRASARRGPFARIAAFPHITYNTSQNPILQNKYFARFDRAAIPGRTGRDGKTYGEYMFLRDDYDIIAHYQGSPGAFYEKRRE